MTAVLSNDSTHPFEAGLLRAPAEIMFGAGSRAGTARAVRRLGCRAAIVVDPFFASSDVFITLLADLDSVGVTTRVYSEVVPELPIATVTAAADALRSHDPDVVLGFGGGSALDLAKLVALLLQHPGPLSEYFGENRVPGDILPLVAMPTTAGTGSEVTPVAVVTDSARDLKVGISDPALIARVAVVDPDLTLGAPATVTAHSGIDALAHAVESHTARRMPADFARSTVPVAVGANTLTSMLALPAVSSLAAGVPRAFLDGEDREARHAAAYGSLLAGLAFGTAGVHLAHAIQYPIGALTHTPHGLGTGLLLPHVMRASIPFAADRLAEIGAAIGTQATGSVEARAHAAAAAVATIAASIGIPAGLREIGIRRDQLTGVAVAAAGITRLAGNAPMDATEQVVEEIVVSAFESPSG